MPSSAMSSKQLFRGTGEQTKEEEMGEDSSLERT